MTPEFNAQTPEDDIFPQIALAALETAQRIAGPHWPNTPLRMIDTPQTISMPLTDDVRFTGTPESIICNLTAQKYSIINAAGQKDIAVEYTVGMSHQLPARVSELLPEYLHSLFVTIYKKDTDGLESILTAIRIKNLPDGELLDEDEDNDSDEMVYPGDTIAKEACYIYLEDNKVPLETFHEQGYVVDEFEMTLQSIERYGLVVGDTREIVTEYKGYERDGFEVVHSPEKDEHSYEERREPTTPEMLAPAIENNKGASDTVIIEHEFNNLIDTQFEDDDPLFDTEPYYIHARRIIDLLRAFREPHVLIQEDE